MSQKPDPACSSTLYHTQPYCNLYRCSLPRRRGTVLGLSEEGRMGRGRLDATVEFGDVGWGGEEGVGYINLV